MSIEEKYAISVHKELLKPEVQYEKFNEVIKNINKITTVSVDELSKILKNA